MFNFFKKNNKTISNNNKKKINSTDNHVNNQKSNNSTGNHVNNQKSTNLSSNHVNNHKSTNLSSNHVNNEKLNNLLENNIHNNVVNNEKNIENTHQMVSKSSHSKLHDKYHFFIGNIFNSTEDIKSLIYLRKKLRQKYKLSDSHWNNNFYTNILYLGYFDTETIELYMDDIIKPLLVALSNKINKLNCKYTGFKIDYDNVFHKISLKFNDENNLLENDIVPYLHNNGVLPIFNKKKTIYKPSIDLLYYKSSSIVHDKKNIHVQVPQNNFIIDHLSLIKGTPIKYRPGTPSLHDQMHIEEIFRYKVDLL